MKDKVFELEPQKQFEFDVKCATNDNRLSFVVLEPKRSNVFAAKAIRKLREQRLGYE